MRKSVVGITKTDKLAVLLTLFVLTGGFAFIHVQSALAAPILLGIFPSNAVVGDAIAAAGDGATPNGEVRLYIGNLLVTSTTANDAGEYSASFTVPPVSAGDQVILASDMSSGDTGTTLLTVEPSIVVTPNVGSFNEKVSIKGEGFAAFRYISLWVEGQNVTPVPAPSTDFLGTFESTIQIPSVPNGTYTFSARDTNGNAAKTQLTVFPKIIAQRTSGPANTFVLVYGYGLNSSIEYKLFFDSIDVTPYGHALTSTEGSLITAFFVPSTTDGIHSISVQDSAGDIASCPFATPSPIMTLDPSSIHESSMVTAKGLGFQPGTPVLLYLEDAITTSIYDLMARTESISPKADGSFEYSFIVPVTEPGTYEITAYQSLGPSTSGLHKVASAQLTIIQRLTVDTDIVTGTLHFRGEIAEFYLKTALSGKLTDVVIDDATVYSDNGTFEQNLTSDVTQVSPGLYRIPYAIPDNASFGTYAIVVAVNLQTDLLDAYGSATGGFVISPFFTTQAAQLLDIQNSIATVMIPDLGTVKANLSTINAKLDSVKNNVATIRSSIGTLQTSADSINATLVGIDGDVATVESDLGTIKTSTDAIHATVTSIENGVATVSSDLGTVKVKVANSSNQSNVAALFAIAAALAASGSAVILYRRKPPQPTIAPAASPPTGPPPPQSEPALTQPEKQEHQSTTQTQTETPAEQPKPAETPAQETQPKAEQPVEPQPQTQSPSDSFQPKESPPRTEPEPQPEQPQSEPQAEPQPQTQPQQSEPESQPQTIILQPEQPIPP